MTWMIRVALTFAVAQLAVGWQIAQHAATPSGMLAVATVVLAAAVIAVVVGGARRSAWPGAAPIVGPRLTAALRRKSWAAVFQRQRNPDAPGRARPRAPSAAPAAA